jgi:hypothetical protein
VIAAKELHGWILNKFTAAAQQQQQQQQQHPISSILFLYTIKFIIILCGSGSSTGGSS